MYVWQTPPCPPPPPPRPALWIRACLKQPRMDRVLEPNEPAHVSYLCMRVRKSPTLWANNIAVNRYTLELLVWINSCNRHFNLLLHYFDFLTVFSQ